MHSAESRSSPHAAHSADNMFVNSGVSGGGQGHSLA